MTLRWINAAPNPCCAALMAPGRCRSASTGKTPSRRLRPTLRCSSAPVAACWASSARLQGCVRALHEAHEQPVLATDQESLLSWHASARFSAVASCCLWHPVLLPQTRWMPMLEVRRPAENLCRRQLRCNAMLRRESPQWYYMRSPTARYAHWMLRLPLGRTSCVLLTRSVWSTCHSTNAAQLYHSSISAMTLLVEVAAEAIGTHLL